MYVVLLFFLCYGVLIGRESAPIAESAGKLRSAESAPRDLWILRVILRNQIKFRESSVRPFGSTKDGATDLELATRCDYDDDLVDDHLDAVDHQLAEAHVAGAGGYTGPAARGSGRARVRRERPPFTVNPKPFTRFCRTLAYACAAKIFYRFLTN